MKRECKDHINPKEMMNKLGLNKRNSFLDRVIYRFSHLFRNSNKNKIKALLEGLEIQEIDRFMNEAKTGDFRTLGKRYLNAVRNKVEDAKNCS